MSDIKSNKIKYEEELIKFVERIEKENIEDISNLHDGYGIFDEWITARLKMALYCKIFRQNNQIIKELQELNEKPPIINLTEVENVTNDSGIEIEI